MTILAIDGGRPVRSGPWARWPAFEAATISRVVEVLRSGELSLTGHRGCSPPHILKLENEIASFYGVSHAIAMASGAAALAVILKSLGLSTGSQVLVPANTWVAVPQCVTFIGAEPVLVDVDYETRTMACDKARDALTPTTKAIILVHQNGAVGDAVTFKTIADAHGISLIEDCSHAHGAKLNGRRVGVVGHAAAFSTQQTKLLCSGEGGFVITNDGNLAEFAARIRGSGRLHRIDSVSDSVTINERANIIGFNFMLSEIAAVLLRDQLSALDERNAIRNYNVKLLSNSLNSIGGINVIDGTIANSERVYHKCVVAFSSELLSRRSLDWFARALSSEVGFAVSRLHDPLFANDLLPDATRQGRCFHSSRSPAFSADRFSATIDAYERCLSFRHQYLLGNHQDTGDIVGAFEKVIAAS